MQVRRRAERDGVRMRRPDQKNVAGVCRVFHVVHGVRRLAFFKKDEFPHIMRMRAVRRGVFSAQQIFIQNHFFEIRRHRFSAFVSL